MPKTANKDLKNHTYCILKERLVNCIYPPGTLLNEAQLAADLVPAVRLCVRPSAAWRWKVL